MTGSPPDYPYTHGHHESVLRSHTWRTVENSAAYLRPRLVVGAEVLDVGCGPGTITADVAGRVAPGRVVGLDRAEAVLARAAETCRAHANVELRVGDVGALPFDDDTFDVVHAHQVLQHLSDPVAALREMRRVCRPGGTVAARDADYGSFAWSPPDPTLDAWLATYRAVARGDGGEPDAGRHLKRWALDAGFSTVRASASIWCFSDEAERRWWAGLWADRLTAEGSTLVEHAVASGAAGADDLAEMAAAFRRWGEDPAAVFTVPHGEVLATP